MSQSDDDFLEELRAAFTIEAGEHLDAMSGGLLEVEKDPASTSHAPLIETICREAHSLKGASRAVNMVAVETVCQALENVFSAWKYGELQPAAAQFDTLYQSLDVIEKLLAAPENGTASAQITPLVQRLGAIKEGKSEPVTAPPEPAPAPIEAPPEIALAPISAIAEEPAAVASPPVAPVASPVAEKATLSETVRISTRKLDALLLQAEEMLVVKLTASQRADDLREAESSLELWKKEWDKISPQLRRARRALDKNNADGAPPTLVPVARLLEFLDWNQTYVKSLESKLTALSRSAEHDQRATSALVNNLLEDTKKLLMMPFATLLGIFPKLVRDLSHDQGKDVQLMMRGSEVEIDKRILEEIKDPLIHLLRNSVDHGIEAPDERVRLGKAHRATVSIVVSRVGGNEVEVLISDDGAGMDSEKIRAAAVRKGALSESEAALLDEAQTLALIFHSGVSTSPIITEISGRGLGMAIVREKVEKLGGSIELETRPGTGTTFRISLPLTLATFKGILTQAAGQIFVIPTADVERVVRIQPGDVQTVENRETIALNRADAGQDLVSLVWLEDVLELPAKAKEESAFLQVVVLGTREKRIAFVVEAILNEQEVLVKSLGDPLSRVRNVAGATVLGSGKAVPILNAADLMKSAVKAGRTTVSATAQGEAAPAKTILIAEDSITSRMLLKNILESSGYQVTTAVDGLEALTTLKTTLFDAVVSDIDMPRMNGFDLTAAIRGDKKLADLPVVLVTGRDSREDRERGIDVGANAYLVKSNFEQSNLLEVIRRLI